jgi:acyl-CoA thioester hydrolase
MLRHQTNLRVRYSETDQMGTFYNSRALEWFECARTETLRTAGIPYAQMESRGVLLPLVEANVKFLGRARYDDLLTLHTTAQFSGKASLRFDVSISQAEGDAPVAEGHTIHAITDAGGKPIRPPQWLTTAVGQSEDPQP